MPPPVPSAPITSLAAFPTLPTPSSSTLPASGSSPIASAAQPAIDAASQPPAPSSSPAPTVTSTPPSTPTTEATAQTAQETLPPPAPKLHPSDVAFKLTKSGNGSSKGAHGANGSGEGSEPPARSYTVMDMEDPITGETRIFCVWIELRNKETDELLGYCGDLGDEDTASSVCTQLKTIFNHAMTSQDPDRKKFFKETSKTIDVEVITRKEAPTAQTETVVKLKNGSSKPLEFSHFNEDEISKPLQDLHTALKNTLKGRWIDQNGKVSNSITDVLAHNSKDAKTSDGKTQKTESLKLKQELNPTQLSKHLTNIRQDAAHKIAFKEPMTLEALANAPKEQFQGPCFIPIQNDANSNNYQFLYLDDKTLHYLDPSANPNGIDVLTKAERSKYRGPLNGITIPNAPEIELFANNLEVQTFLPSTEDYRQVDSAVAGIHWFKTLSESADAPKEPPSAPKTELKVPQIAKPKKAEDEAVEEEEAEPASSAAPATPAAQPKPSAPAKPLDEAFAEVAGGPTIPGSLLGKSKINPLSGAEKIQAENWYNELKTALLGQYQKLGTSSANAGLDLEVRFNGWSSESNAYYDNGAIIQAAQRAGLSNKKADLPLYHRWLKTLASDPQWKNDIKKHVTDNLPAAAVAG